MVPNALSLLCLGALGWMFTTFNGTQAEVYYMMMFISIVCDDASLFVRFARVWGFITSSALKDLRSLEKKFLILLMVLSDSSNRANVLTRN